MNIDSPTPAFSNGRNPASWPTDDFKPNITLDVTAGQFTVSGSIDNIGDFVYGNPVALQATATLYINGSQSTTYTIDSQSGALSGGAPQAVNPGDVATLRFEAKATIATPYDNQTVIRHDCEWTVPAGDGNITFSTTSNPQQTPAWDASFGWDGGSGNLKWTNTPSASGGSTKNLTITTQLANGGSKSSTNAGQSPPGSTTHTASFNKAAASGGFEVWLQWPNNAGNRATLLAMKFRNNNAVGTADTFEQNKVSDVAQWKDA